MRNKIKRRKKYKIGKSPTPESKISIILFTRGGGGGGGPETFPVCPDVDALC